jgi:hypothetical protein
MLTGTAMHHPDRPSIVMVAVFMEGLPFVLGLLLAGRQTDARRWFMLQAAICSLTNGISSYLGGRQLYNVFLDYYYIPVEGALLFWMLSHWEVTAAARRRVRLAIPVMVAAWIVIAWRLEDRNTFSTFGDNFYNLLMIALMVSILVRRSAVVTASLLSQDWFWICGGLAMHFAAFTAFNAVAARVAGSDWTLLARIITGRSWLNAIAMSLACIGMFCPPSVTDSSGRG